MSWKEMLLRIQERSRTNFPFSGDEYVNEADNGLLYCNKCHTRRQTSIWIEENGERFELRPPVLCKCMQEAQAAEERERKEREMVHEIAVMRSRSGIPTLYRDATFDGFIQRPDNAAVYRMAVRYAEKFEEMKKLGKGLLMHGGVGTGKTYTAVCIANKVLDMGYSVFMTSTYDMLKLRDSDDEVAYDDRIMKCSLLIIDDIGAERTTDYGREKVFGYIDGRCSTNLPMIFTTNIDFQTMLKPETKQESRIYDRILKRCFPVAFEGTSWRRSEARDNFAEMKAILNGDD